MRFNKFFRIKKVDTPYKPDNKTLKIHGILQRDLALVEELFSDCSDLIIREFTIKPPYNVKAALVCMDGMVNKQALNLEIMKPLMHDENYPNYDKRPILDIIVDFTLTVGEMKKDRTIDALVNSVLSGDTILLLEDSSEYLILNTKGFDKRSVENPDAENVIRGPKEGFTEVLTVNTALIRRKLKTPELKIQSLRVGKRSNTDVAIAYIEGIVTDELLDEVKKRLNTIDIDGVLESGYIEEFIEDNPYSPFPQVMITERPDKVAANLLEGRIAILTDGSPMVIIAPAVFVQFYQSPEDYYERAIYGTGVRFFRLIGFIMGTTLPALYVALISFHHQLIPSRLILTIAKAREGVPFPAVVEALMMEITLDLIREASIRLPGNIGQTIGIVGALVLGQAAIQAKIVSPVMVVIVALTGIGAYIAPNFSTSYSMRLIRYPMIIAAAVYGAYGVALFWLFILIHLCTLESFGVPYLSPVAPFKTSFFKDTIFRIPLWWMRTRSNTPKVKDKRRLGKTKGGHEKNE